MNRDNMLNHLAHTLPHWPTEYTDMTEPGRGWAWYDEEPDCTLVLCKGEEEIREADYLQRRAEVINRPSWEGAPEWAQWLAQDEDGEWYWFEQKPTKGDSCWAKPDAMLALAESGIRPSGHDWRDTLEPRPQAQSDIKKCKHCGVTFQRPHLDSIPDDRCNRCDEEIKALWPESETTTRWTSKTCTECGNTTAAKVSDDNPVCPGCVAVEYAEDSDAESALSQSIRELADKHPEPATADSILIAAVRHMRDRAATYDKPQGERSMGATVAAFRATTGIELTEEQGWHFMALLKLVRSQQGGYRADSYEDGAAYVALAGEAAAKGRGE